MNVARLYASPLRLAVPWVVYFVPPVKWVIKRNLSNGEIVEQVLYYARQLKANNQRVTNVVIMGMGEPFHNYEATLSAIDRLNNPDGLNLGERRFTISTVGLVPMIRICR